MARTAAKAARAISDSLDGPIDRTNLIWLIIPIISIYSGLGWKKVFRFDFTQ